MKKIITVFLFTPMAVCAFDYNDNRQAIENIKDSWVIPYLGIDGNYTGLSFNIDSVRFALLDGYYGKGSNPISSIFGSGSDITCIYTNKPTDYQHQYECFDLKSNFQDYWYFDLKDGVITGQFHEVGSIIGNRYETINRSVKFTGYSSEKYKTAPTDYVEYKSGYDLIQWPERKGHMSYCIDITDENWNIYPGFQAVKCGSMMANFSPADYVKNVMKLDKPVGFRFNWRVWSGSKDLQGNVLPGASYGGLGYEGKVIVQ